MTNGNSGTGKGAKSGRNTFTFTVYREKAHKPKMVMSFRLTESDVEFLETLKDKSDFIHEAIEAEKRKRLMLEGKGLPYEIVREIAEGFIHRSILYIDDEQDFSDEIEFWNQRMGDVLFHIATLNCKTPSPWHPEQIVYPHLEDLTYLLDGLQSKEAKDFVSKIKANVEQALDKEAVSFCVLPEKLQPLTEDEIETVRKIFDEAKDQVEQKYRRLFHKLPPEDWHRYVFREDGKRRFKLP
jgi:hypothetical protein